MGHYVNERSRCALHTWHEVPDDAQRVEATSSGLGSAQHCPPAEGTVRRNGKAAVSLSLPLAQRADLWARCAARLRPRTTSHQHEAQARRVLVAGQSASAGLTSAEGDSLGLGLGELMPAVSLADVAGCLVLVLCWRGATLAKRSAGSLQSIGAGGI